jgi:hypothetical protein
LPCCSHGHRCPQRMPNERDRRGPDLPHDPHDQVGDLRHGGPNRQ